MTSKEKIKEEILNCINMAEPLLLGLQDKPSPINETKDKSKKKKKILSFHHEYQKWYSRALLRAPIKLIIKDAGN